MCRSNGNLLVGPLEVLAASRRRWVLVRSRRGFSYFSGCDQPRRQPTEQRAECHACVNTPESRRRKRTKVLNAELPAAVIMSRSMNAASTRKSDSATPSRFNWRAAGLRGPANLSAFLKRAPNCAKRGVPGFTTALKVLGVIRVDAVYCGSQLPRSGSALRIYPFPPSRLGKGRASTPLLSLLRRLRPLRMQTRM